VSAAHGKGRTTEATRAGRIGGRSDTHTEKRTQNKTKEREETKQNKRRKERSTHEFVVQANIAVEARHWIFERDDRYARSLARPDVHHTGVLELLR
jgi:hypothetical protein